MHLVKWFRKNNTKIMAVVVIVLMIGFVGGSSLQYLLQGSRGMRSAIAYYGQKRKINRYDVDVARQELELLEALRADAVLQSQDLRGVLLGELLFSERRGSPELLTYVMQTIRRNQYRISDKQLAAMYRPTGVIPAFYWILLRDEAESAGMRVRNEDVGRSLSQVIPQLFNGQSYSAVIRSLVARYGVSEGRILETFGRLLAVLQYAQTACSTGSITDSQIRHMAGRENTRLDTEFVQIEASAFADKENKPAREEMLAHFDKYKAYFAAEVTESNPYGFGYKFPARVQLDYIAIKLADVSSIVRAPTDEEAEAYFKENRSQLFTEQVQTDPNDPNVVEERVKSYVDVVDTIMDQLRRRKITTKAEQILQEGKNLADAGLAAAATEGEKPTVEQLRERAGDYHKIAQELVSKHGVALYSGQTGLLSPVDMQTDERLGRLFVTGQGPNPIPLRQVLFSTEALGESAATLLFASSAELYTSIGPATDAMATMGPDLSGEIMVIARITQALKAAEPESLDATFSTKGLELGDTPETPEDSTYSVSEKVAEDLGKLAAWDTTRNKAEEFVAMAAKDDWDSAVASFNELYGEQAKAEPNDPNVFKLDQLAGLQEISSAQLQVIAAQVAGNAAAEIILREVEVQKRFIDRLYALVPPGADAAPQMPEVIEFKPNQSFYCVRSASVDRPNQQQYQSMKGMLLLREEHTQMQSLAAVHFDPANILKRMKFRPARETQEPTEDQAEQAPEETT
jgi:hypothetical protein